MAISRVDQRAVASSAAETSHAITLPTVQDNDLVLIAVGIVAATPPTVSLPGGWSNDVPIIRPGTSTIRAGLWSKKAVAATDSGASITVSSTVSGQLAIVARTYRGVDPSTPYDVTIATDTSATADATPDCPSITPANNGTMIVGVYSMATSTGTAWSDWTAPSGLGNALNAGSTVASVNNAALGTSDLLQATAAATGVMTATAGPSGTPQAHPWVAMSVALRPAGITPPSGGMWGVHL